MEDVLEKLLCLDYELLFVRNLKQQPIGKFEFIAPSQNAALQFNHYIQTIKWLLLQIIGGDSKSNTTYDALEEFQDVDIYDDPNVIAKKLMLSLRELGYEIDFPIPMLKQPYGEIATSILNFLADTALECKNFYYDLEPQYITEKLKEGDNSYQNESEEIIDTDEESLEDDSRQDSIEAYYEISNVETSNQLKSHNNSTSTMITSEIDPVEWKVELERVSPSLEIQFDDLDNEIILGRSWRKQVNSALLENEKILLEMDRSNDALQRLCKESTRTLETIDIKEEVINDKFKDIVEEWKLLSHKERNLKQTEEELTSQVDVMNNQIISLSKQLNDVRSKVDEKGNRMTDTSPLIEIKTTLKNMKGEIRDFDLQIGILEHNLIQKRIAKANSK